MSTFFWTRLRAFRFHNGPETIVRTLTTDRPHYKHKRLGGGPRKHRPIPSQNARRVQLSKTLSYLLRHGAESNGLSIRSDGFVKVKDLLKTAELCELDFMTLEKIVQMDNKQRFTMSYQLPGVPGSSSQLENWWIRANQGHSLTSVADLELKRLKSPEDVPMAVHGTSTEAWKSIAAEGLSKKTRNHIHLAQGLSSDGVISGMRKGSRILIYIDLEKAMGDGIKFYLSSNGVLLTEGENGVLKPKYFHKVEILRKTYQAIPGWEGKVDEENKIQSLVEDTDEAPPPSMTTSESSTTESLPLAEKSVSESNNRLDVKGQDDATFL
ncbi:hypothetical protein L218DRAFT_857261 [Marasmius fiardii PR-910]|nr:hypothetical protein L218DRAFT_857261 [Marasmius fiardii PR-910]